MSIFQNPLTSIAGIKERLGNVGKTLVSSFTLGAVGGKVESASSSKLVKAVSEAVGQNPYSSVVAVATAGSSSARTAVVKAVSSLSGKTKVIIGTATLGTTGFLATSPASVAPVISTVSNLTPESILRAGAAAGTVKEGKKSALDAISENKVLAGAALITGAAVLGKNIPSVANTLAIWQNTKATAKKVEVSMPENLLPIEKQSIEKAPVATVPSSISSPISATPVPTTPEVSSLTPTKQRTATKRRKSHVCSRGAKSINSAKVKLYVDAKCQ